MRGPVGRSACSVAVVAAVGLAGFTLNVGGAGPGAGQQQPGSGGTGIGSPSSAATPTTGMGVAKAASSTTTSAPTYETVKTGVVRVQSAGCSSPSSGTGFFVGKNLIVTAAHVVTEANTIAVRSEIGSVGES